MGNFYDKRTINKAKVFTHCCFPLHCVKIGLSQVFVMICVRGPFIRLLSMLTLIGLKHPRMQDKENENRTEREEENAKEEQRETRHE